MIVKNFKGDKTVNRDADEMQGVQVKLWYSSPVRDVSAFMYRSYTNRRYLYL